MIILCSEMFHIDVYFLIYILYIVFYIVYVKCYVKYVKYHVKYVKYFTCFYKPPDILKRRGQEYPPPSRIKLLVCRISIPAPGANENGVLDDFYFTWTLHELYMYIT